MSPETTLLTPRAEHPPGESGREKSRAALMWKKVTLTNVHLPSFSRSDAWGSLCPPHRPLGTGPPAERDPSAAFPPGVPGSPWRQGSGTGTVRPPSPRRKTYF